MGYKRTNWLFPISNFLSILNFMSQSTKHPDAFPLGNLTLGSGALFLIAGPCVLESEAHARTMADAIQRIASDLGIPYIFKASFDKANRTSIHSFRGPGLQEGCRILRTIAETHGLPVLTDVHTPDQCAPVSDAIGSADILLQIPAFLCRQTDLLAAAAATGRAINVKKGQFVAPNDMRHAVEKVRESTPAGIAPRVSLTERGASFGYNNLVVDMRAMPQMRAFAPVVFDATHSVQTPSSTGAGDKNGVAVSGGAPEFIPTLARAAVAAGIDGIFLEVHDNPAMARSDGANALRLDLLKPLLKTLLAVHQAVK
jgi:2-dehydro-3-deoxyphosphooctonate aldolase (KDO 8-P synthase)